MGQAIRIGDLARRIIEWGTPAGQTPVGIDIIGLRAGEKLREELTTQGLEMKKTSHPRIWSARQKDVARVEIIKAVRQLRRACASGDATMALDTLARAAAGYEPSEVAIKAARSASRRVGATSAKVTTAVA
jgi:FlaA1/EpsC-like NDP-sugar epimerase